MFLFWRKNKQKESIKVTKATQEDIEKIKKAIQIKKDSESSSKD